ncbi:MAG: multicopper oxidase domain-containing protein, partial [Candidatus Aenigmarchaeota archaeon]|nr:multicopper oxidase domain-containing protein [Candidatus Aenigmarchaeota archaeon]
MKDIKWSAGKTLLAVIAVSAATSMAFGLYFLPQSQSQSFAMPMTQSMLRGMMGQSDLNSVPLKTAMGKTEQLGFEVKDGVKEFKLSAEPIRWEYADGQWLTAWGYNGQVPGPAIRVKEGDKVRIVFTNKLPKATTIHWHGIDVPSNMDGVPGVSQLPIMPNETFTYEFVAKPAGTRFYHTHGSSHEDEAQQLDMGLSGAFIIEPAAAQTYDKEYTFVLDEWEVMPNNVNAAMLSNIGGDMLAHSMNYNLFTINGKAFPDTEPIAVQSGDRILVRLINAGSSATHPMHLHG